MSVTQFAMVEELAFLVKDNLRCKHLVLSVEDAFINFLRQNNLHNNNSSVTDDDNKTNEIIELEPMDAYSRLLLHRLADIFGFGHVSVGEGDERHLVLEKCPETSIISCLCGCRPSILVSDILFHYDGSDEPLTESHQLLRRNDASPVSLLKAKSPSLLTLEEREAAYLAARERIFSMDVGEMKEPQKQKPRTVPVVARRMIAHALGQKITPDSQDVSVNSSKGYKVQSTQLNVQDEDKMHPNSGLEDLEGTRLQLRKKVHSPGQVKSGDHQSSASLPVSRNTSNVSSGKIVTNSKTSHNGSSRNRAKEYSKEQQVGAAKRMFANALGLRSARGAVARSNATKSANTE